MKTIYAVGTFKGGSGKSATAIHLACGFARRGLRTLFIDMDHQANSTKFFSGSMVHGLNVAHGLLQSASADEIITRTQYGLVDLLPASADLSGVGFHLSQPNELQREQRLANLLAPIRDRYAAAVIDLPPARETLTINGLVAANRYLVPVAPGGWDLDGLEKMLSECGRISKIFHQGAATTRIILSRQNRSKVAKEIDKSLRAAMPKLVCTNAIPEATKVPEALYARKTVWEHSPDHAVALAFNNLTSELIAYENQASAA